MVVTALEAAEAKVRAERPVPAAAVASRLVGSDREMMIRLNA
jgi:hypothetical protein